MLLRISDLVYHFLHIEIFQMEISTLAIIFFCMQIFQINEKRGQLSLEQMHWFYELLQ